MGVSRLTAGHTSQAEKVRAVLASNVEKYLAPRHVSDILADFPAARLEPPQVRRCLTLPPTSFINSNAPCARCHTQEVCRAVVEMQMQMHRLHVQGCRKR